MSRGWLPKAALLTGTGTAIATAGLMLGRDDRAPDAPPGDAEIKNEPERIEMPAVQFAPAASDGLGARLDNPLSRTNGQQVTEVHGAVRSGSRRAIAVSQLDLPVTLDRPRDRQQPTAQNGLARVSRTSTDPALTDTACAASCPAQALPEQADRDPAISPIWARPGQTSTIFEVHEREPATGSNGSDPTPIIVLPVPAFGAVSDPALETRPPLPLPATGSGPKAEPALVLVGEAALAGPNASSVDSLPQTSPVSPLSVVGPDPEPAATAHGPAPVPANHIVSTDAADEQTTLPNRHQDGGEVPCPSCEEGTPSLLAGARQVSALSLRAEEDSQQRQSSSAIDSHFERGHQASYPIAAGSMPQAPAAALAPAPSPERTLPTPLFGQGEHPPVPAALNRPVPARSTRTQAATLATTPRPGTTTANAADSASGTGLGAGLLAADTPMFTDDDELVISLRTASGEIEETITAFGTRQGVFLPLGELSRILDLAIRISDEGHYASGWIIEPARSVSLNLRAREGIIAGKATQLSPALFASYQGDIFVRSDALASILPVEVKVDLRDQAVIITLLEKFPFQARLEREAERQRLASRQGASQKENAPLEPTPWAAYSMPVSDVEMRAVTDDTFGSRLELEMRAAADLAFVTARGYLEASSRDGLTGVRMEFGRRDPAATLLGPLHATQFAIGDIATVSQAIGLRSVAGRGLFVSNAPLDESSVFDRIDLRGPLPDGYEVELYRNNVLIGASQTAVNGQYEFLQIPLDFGANVLRLVFYGPQGQTREEVRRFNVGNGRLATGDFVYDLGVVQKDRPLIAVRPPLYLATPSEGQWRASGNIAYGMSSRVTLAGGMALAWNKLGELPGIAGNIGIRSEIAGLPWRLDAALQQGGARALRGAVAARMGAIGVSMAHGEYRGGFIDEVQAFEAVPLRRASSLDVNGALPFGSTGLPFIARLSRLAFADGRSIETASLRTSLRIGTALLSPALEYNASAAGLATSSRLAASFDLALFAGSRTRIRASTTVDLLGSPTLSQISGQIDRTLSARQAVRIFASHSFPARQSQIGGSFSHRFDNASLALDASASFPTHAHYIGLRLSTGFLQNPFSRRIQLAMPGVSSGGLLAVRTYRDENANGIQDAGDAPIANVAVIASGKAYETDDDGIALVPSLGDGQKASYGIDEATLPDITLAPGRKGSAFVARAGRIHSVGLGIVSLSDIEGQAVYSGAATLKGVSGLQMVLTDLDGNARGRARSRAGGSFLFERVPPGRYRIEIAADQAERLGIGLATPVVIELSGKADIVRANLLVKDTQSLPGQ